MNCLGFDVINMIFDECDYFDLQNCKIVFPDVFKNYCKNKIENNDVSNFYLDFYQNKEIINSFENCMNANLYNFQTSNMLQYILQCNNCGIYGVRYNLFNSTSKIKYIISNSIYYCFNWLTHWDSFTDCSKECYCRRCIDKFNVLQECNSCYNLVCKSHYPKCRSCTECKIIR